ncbi:MAG: phosphotransferase family protein [Bradyrhizobiaceae bacterium]|nr:phosphotransferase family protein [Bradyrhizobiaceae bacterium]
MLYLSGDIGMSIPPLMCFTGPAGLGDYGKPDNYFARQIARWRKQYEQTRTEALPAMESLIAWLDAHIPDDQTAAIAHGDFRIGNLIFDGNAPRVIAVLDWELSTIGHPLGDLAFNCMTYHLPAGDAVAAGFVGADIAALGIPAEKDYVAAYARRAGFDPAPLWRFGMAFSLFRTAAIQQGVYARSLRGNASSSTAHLFGASFRRVAEAGWRVASGA